ncbi:hypothetical protein [Parasitella parasitica]|uniref:Rieske domain-containing protein n=1 Tax=Parasitella parasitica TaxID=35722 RepID=A0A0B7NUZ1_9FUNG|nr:hypothetical protein [Parasitella parasitica]
MFEPTIKYKSVNNPTKAFNKSADENKNIDTSAKEMDTSKSDSGLDSVTKSATTTESYSFSFEEEDKEDSKIEVDPDDNERIIITLSTGKQFSADRYCPHAGADLSYHGKVAEDDYPPEIGPVLMCPIHYWEFALEKGGRGGSGFTSINACPIEAAEKCLNSQDSKKLDW